MATDQLNDDLFNAPWIVGETFDAIEDQYDAWKTIFESILEKICRKRRRKLDSKMYHIRMKPGKWQLGTKGNMN